MIATGLLVMLLQTGPVNTPRIYVYSALPGQSTWTYSPVILDAPLTLSLKADGPHLSAYTVSGPPGPAGPKGSDASYAFGPGFLTIPLAPYPTQVQLDTALVAVRVDPPKGPGPCGPSVAVEGGVSTPTPTAAFATDANWRYDCTLTSPGAWAWARSALSTSW